MRIHRQIIHSIVHSVAYGAFAALLTVSVTTSDAEARVLGPIELANRCYARLTRKPLPRADARLKKIVTLANAADFCSALVDAPVVDKTSGKLSIASNTWGITLDEGLRILATFNDLHRSWFRYDDLNGASGQISINFYYKSRAWNLYDEAEGALHVSRALFTPDVPYKEIVTGTMSVEAIREFEVPTEAFKRTDPSGNWDYSGVGNGPFQIPGVMRGKLLGVRAITDDNPKRVGDLDFTIYPSQSNNAVSIHAGNQWLLRPNSTIGGGLLGTNSYLLLNLGRIGDYDGGVAQPRRFSESVLKDLLCRQSPGGARARESQQLPSNGGRCTAVP